MPMPYHLDKGPVMTYLEGTLNGSLATVASGLTQLRAGSDLFGLGGVDPTTGTLEKRLREHWFGQQQTDSGAWEAQEPFSVVDPQPTGYWKGYHGEVSAIIREALIRAAEVSLGLEHDGAIPQTAAGDLDPPRRWPVEVFWACPNPWFEAWVTWRDHGDDGHGNSRGQVMLLLKSPGDTFNTTISDLTAPPHPFADMLDPASSDTEQGMWVISHARHAKHSTLGLVEVPPDSPLDALIDAVQAQLDEQFDVAAENPVWYVPQLATLWQGSDDGAGPDIAVVSIPHADGGVSTSV